MNSKHIVYIDALKGVSCIMVLLGHFVLAFPQLAFLKEIPIVKDCINGLFPVHTFILLAGFSLCCSLEGKDVQYAIKSFVCKRYLRFVVPIIFPTIVAYCICNFNLGYNQQWALLTDNEWLTSFLPADASIKDLIKSILFAPVSITPLINPLWMLQYIFLGNFIILPLIVCVNTFKMRCVKCVFLVFFMILLSKITIFYCTMLSGVLVYQLYKEYNKSWMIAFVCLSLFVSLTFSNIGNVDFWRALLFVLTFTIVPTFSIKYFNQLLLWLGKISFEIYIIHSLVICSLSCFLVLKLGHSLENIVEILLITVCVVLFVSYLLNKFNSKLNKYVSLLLKL